VAYTLPTDEVDELPWFPHWLKTQISKQPKWLFSALADQDFDEKNPSDEALLKSVRGLFDDVRRLCKAGFQDVRGDCFTLRNYSTTGQVGSSQYQNSDEGRDDERSDDEAVHSEALYCMRMLFRPEVSHVDTAEDLESRPVTVRYIAEQLIKEGRLRKCEPIFYRLSQDLIEEYPNKAEALIFAILGWQTMLYRPCFFGRPTANQLSISLSYRNGRRGNDDRISFRGKVDINGVSRGGDNTAFTVPLPDLFAGFGLLIPDATDWHSGDEVEGDKTVTSSSFNAHLLNVIGRVNFEWTDCLPCHLDYDIETKTVYLFQYPSFCQHSLEARWYDSTMLILRCAEIQYDHLGRARWFGPEAERLRSMLEEVLLSYRLLFGQNKASRKFFLEIYPFKYKLAKERDDTLMMLCGPDWSKSVFSWRVTQREEYILSEHFPVLGSRLVPLLRHLSNKQPQTWRQLWKDKRDSASWFTFWAVIIIGGIGIILAFVQVILQAIALGLQYHH
jgi:hypothetical protein